MLYKFKSQAAADVIMQSINGEQMLSIVGKSPESPGIITVEQIPAALAALEAAIVAHETEEALRSQDPSHHAPVEGDGIRLRQRAEPFIDLLKVSAAAGKDVVWGV